MGPDKLDNFIKRKVQNLETDSDTSLLWQKIQAKQQAKKKDKRRFFFLWFFAGIFCLTCGSFLFYQFSNQTQESKNTEVQTSIKNAQDPIAKPFNKPTLSKSSEIAINTDIKIESKDNSKIISNTIVNTNDLLNKTKGPKILKNKQKSQFDLSGQSKQTDQAFQIISQIESTLINKNTLNSFNPTTQSVDIAVSNQKQTSVAMLAPLALRSTYLTIPNSIESLEKETLPLFKDRLETNTKKLSFVTGVYFNYGAIDRSLKSTNTEYLQMRENNETPLDVFNIGMNIKIQHQNNFYLKTGIEYQQINERFDSYKTWDSTIIQPNQILTIIYDMDGQSSSILGDGLVDETYYTSKKIYNRYRSIELPIAFGYARSKGKLNWFVDGGLALNLWFQANGEIVSASDSFILLDDDQSYFKSKTGLSLISSVGLSYQYNKQWSLSASPNFKYQLKSISSNQNLIDQKYFMAGLQLGLNFHW